MTLRTPLRFSSPDMIEGLAGPYLAPVPLPEDPEATTLGWTWASLYCHLQALHAIYANVGVRRPLGKLHDLVTVMTPVVYKVAGKGLARAASREAVAYADSLESPIAMVSHGQEAGLWVVILQATLALGTWYGLSPNVDAETAQIACDLSASARRALATVFDSRTCAAIYEAAHGLEQSEFLSQVTAGAFALGAQFDGLEVPK